MSELHREAIYKYIVIAGVDDYDEYALHYVCKGDGFKFNIVASTHSYEDAEEMAIAMNYWETRPSDMGDGA